MNIKLSFLIPVLMATLISCTDIYPPGPPRARKSPINPEAHLFMLENQTIVIGLLPDTGGHIVLFRTHGGLNVLKSVPKLWMEPGPQISAEEASSRPLHGHVFWAVTQNELPPDHLPNLGKYEIVEKTNESVTLKSPQSPIRGIQMTKEIKLKGNKVFLKVTATNILNSDVSLNINSKTHFRSDSYIYVPVKKDAESSIKEPSVAEPGEQVLQYQITDGFLNYDIANAATGKKNVFTCNTLINPSEAYMAVFTEDSLLIKRTSPVPKESIPAGNAFFEVHKLAGNTSGALTEIRINSPYQTLKPGQSMSFEEEWEIVPYEGLNGTAERIKFLKEHLK